MKQILRKMRKTLVFIFLSFITTASVAQDFSRLWEGYFSYFEINAITQGNDKVYAAAENAIFSFDVLTNEVSTITTIDGLSGETISTIKYSPEFESLIIGYTTGLIEIFSESDNSILSVVDILEKQTISPALKNINHFNENNGLIYISTDYGISVYDLNFLQFGDSYFIGDGGTQIEINQTAIFNGSIYAACGTNSGLRKANLTNPNLIDFNQWTTIAPGNFEAVESVGEFLYALQNNNVMSRVEDDILSPIFTYNALPTDVRAVDGNLIVTNASTTFIYNADFSTIANISPTELFDTNFFAATTSNDDVYIATQSLGVLKTSFENTSEFTELRPEGPLSNAGFKIEAGDNELWLTYGAYSQFYNPAPVNSRGISHLVDGVWFNKPFDSLLGARELCDIAINPFNPSQVFISSFQDGLLEINNDVPTVLYNQSNSGLESIILAGNPNFISIRVSGSQFDRNGLLWTVSSLVERPLKSYDPSTGQWQSYNFSDLLQDPVADDFGFGDLAIGNNGNFWIGSYQNGLIGYNINTGEINNVASEEQNMPSTITRAVAVDNNNTIWIGTDKGLRLLFNSSGFTSDPDPRVNTIVILDDGIGTELLSNQFITDIKVDGSNNKWVGTLDSGIFYFSPDGQETIYQFTTENSPLPSNSVSDISIDPVSGRVYISTSKGLVSFSSGGTAPQETLADAYVYPNPVRPEYDILGFDDLNNINNGIKISGLTENVNIKITDIEGNLVAEAQSRINQRSSRGNYNFAIDGGTGIWNGKNLGGNVVASGVYLLLISDLESFETKVLKVMIVR